jgi:hypothetical protein
LTSSAEQLALVTGVSFQLVQEKLKIPPSLIWLWAQAQDKSK